MALLYFAYPLNGRRQAGAVLRYLLLPENSHRPMLYARATSALASPREREVAAGVTGRPFAGLPLSVAGEMRISQGAFGREVRPAAFAVTELPPATPPFGLRGEAYAQAGYVGGHFATPFVDGQARLDMGVAHFGKQTQVGVGGGIWGGAEKQAGRLDVGPSATLNFRLGDTQARLAVDHGLRVAGSVAPKSGPALTFSAGF